MADFNVKVKDVENSAGFLGTSRGANAPEVQQTIARPSTVQDTSASTQGLSALVGGVGNLFSAVVDTADSLIKRDVDRRATEAADQIFDEFGVSDATTIYGSDVNNEPTPEEINRAEKNLKRLYNANSRGALSDTAFAARADAVARQLRARYPGHRDYIDQRISNVTGVRPANAIVRGLMEQASAQRSAAGQGEKDRLQYLESITKAGLYKPGMENLGYMELLQTTGPMYAERQKIDVMKSQIELARAQNQATGELAARAAKQTINLQMMDTLSNVTSPMGKTYQEITSKIREINTSGKELSADEQTMLRASFSQLKQDFLGKAQEGLFQFGADITEEQRKEALAPATAFFQNIEDGLVSKDTGALNRAVNRLEAMKTGADIKLYQTAPELEAIAAMNRTLGPQAAAIVLGSSDKLNSAYLKVLVDDSIVDAFGKKTPLKQVFDANNSRDSTNASVVNRAVFDSTLSILTDPSISPEVKAEAADRLYGEGNAGFITTRNPADRMEMYRRMVNQDTFNAVKLAAQKNPEVMENYKGWARDTFLKMSRLQSNTIKNMVESNPGLIKFNPKTGMLETAPLQDVGPGTSRFQGTGDVAALDRNERIKEARPVVNEFNSLIAGLSPVLKEDGKEVGQYVNTVLGGLGVSVPAVEAVRVSGVNLDNLSSISAGLAPFNFEPQSGRESTNIEDRRGQEFTQGFLDTSAVYVATANEEFSKLLLEAPANYDRDELLFEAGNRARARLGYPPQERLKTGVPLTGSVQDFENRQTTGFGETVVMKPTMSNLVGEAGQSETPFGSDAANRKVESGVVLPLTTYADGSTRVDWDAGIPGAIMGWFGTVKELMQGPPEGVADPVKWMAEKSAEATMGVYMGSVLVPVKGTALRTFGGIKGATNLAEQGETLPLEAITKALAMEEQGVKYRDIVKQINSDPEWKGSSFGGVSKGADGKWRLEFSDDAASFVGGLPEKQGDSYRARLDAVIEPGSPLFDAYPQLRNKTIEVFRDSKSEGGVYRSIKGKSDVDITLRADSLISAKSILLHEIQHGLQQEEGHAFGGSVQGVAMSSKLNKAYVEEAKELNKYQQPILDQINALKESTKVGRAQAEQFDKLIGEVSDGIVNLIRSPAYREAFGKEDAPIKRQIKQFEDFRKELNDTKQKIRDQNWANTKEEAKLYDKMRSLGDAAFNTYKKIMGEVEARNVQRRLFDTPEQRRAVDPMDTEDVPRGQQISPFTGERSAFKDQA
jgi:hypothetical protein